ncbi:protein RESTRICTED TEV MOVEMENT 2-like [Phragmites australis]|uniref:protein RESTRICTED TEV MOVEMENT 2-like n=1 Tax=Phragmites australis TaxID=29695 RepID=UPI002D783BAA|nr:protein RESTRICTED TEV MOVEMENT 2-like [Phragmites australis]
MATKMQAAAAADQELDPKYEWQENAANFVLRLHLSGFRKEDFRVQVDGAGRLTVSGQHADGGKLSRIHKVFQLPAASNLDDISGRFYAGVLTVTVPKHPAAPTANVLEEIKKQPKELDGAKPKALVDEAKPEVETKRPPKDEGKPKDDAKKQAEHKEEIMKPKEDAKNTEQIKEEEEEAKRSKREQEHHKTAPPAVRKEEGKPKVEDAAAAPAQKKQAEPEATVVDRDSLAERVRRRDDEERVKAAAAAEEAERERTTARCGWKERVAEGLTGTEWAEGLVETVKKNKEVIAAAVAAFSIGLFVSRRLFSRN